MEHTKDKLNEYWVISVNRLLKKLGIETVTPEEFITLIIQNTENILNLTVICNTKMLVLSINQATSKFTGGWKHF